MALSTPLQRLFLSLGLLMDPDPTTQYPFAILKAPHGPLPIATFREHYLGASAAHQSYNDAYVVLLETMKHTATESKSEHEYLRVTVCPTPSHWNDERSYVRIILERHAFIPPGSSQMSSAFSRPSSGGSVDALDVIGLHDPTTSKTRRVNYMRFSPPNSTSVVPRDGSLPFFLFILAFSRVRDVLASYNLKKSDCYVLARGTMEVLAKVTRPRVHQASDSRDINELTDPDVGSSSNALSLPTSTSAGRCWGISVSQGFSEGELEEIVVALESDVKKVGTYWDCSPPCLVDNARVVGVDRGAAQETRTSVKTTMKNVRSRLRITIDRIFRRT